MELQDVIRKRKMARSFEDRPIPRELLERILANAQKAPSAGFSQGWAFLVLEGKAETALLGRVVARAEALGVRLAGHVQRARAHHLLQREGDLRVEVRGAR